MKTLLSRLAPQSINKQPSFWRVPGRIGYIVNHSYPYSSNGYAVRTHGVATALVEHGHSVVAINRPGLPWDLPGFENDQFPLNHEIDGVRYLHLHGLSHKGKAKVDYLAASAEELKTTLRVFKPTVVMAASNWENALPAAIAARELGLPFFYEVRGFWEITRVSREPEWQNSAKFKHYVEMETIVAQAADRVFTLNRFMRDELVLRGVDVAKIDLVPNAYGALPDISRPPHLTKADIGCNTCHVVGYVGSFNEYEGLDDLVRACAQLRKQGVDLSLLLVGSSSPIVLQESTGECPASAKLKQLAQELGFAGYLHLPGRVTPDSLADYYRLIDLVVIPRKPLPVCELVSPIKPLEAAAFGKAMLVSDVGPLKEMIEELGAGGLFKAGDIGVLSQEIHQLLFDNERRIAFARAEQKWVEERRNWQSITLPIHNITSTVAVRRQSIQKLESPRQFEDRKKEKLGKKTASELKMEAGIIGWPENNQNNSKPIVLGVMDEFTTGCFNKDVNLIQPRPDNCEALAQKYKPSMIFVESAWKGNIGSWQYRVATYSNKPGNEVSQLSQYGRENNVPVIFWNKEDPVHHDKFLESAKLADIIFTTDANMVPSYVKKTGNRKVYPLPFAAQPSLHKPRPLTGRIQKSCFAGSWYGGRHIERGAAMQWLLKVAKPLGLDIYDRNHGTGVFPFPDEYQESIKGSLPYEQLCNEYGRYRVFLNVNSVTNSPTMFSRRVFELMACGTPVVSTYARGIEEMFGKDAVWLVSDESEAKHALQVLFDDDQEWRKRSLAGLRMVFSAHTYKHRLQYIYKILGINDLAKVEPSVLLISKTHNATEGENLLNFAREQSWQGFTLYVESSNSTVLSRKVPANINLLNAGSLCNSVFREILGKYDFVGWLDPSSSYGKHYLQDLVNSTRYAPQASAWGKSVKGDQFTFDMPVYEYASIHRTSSFAKDVLVEPTNPILQNRDTYCLDAEGISLGSDEGRFERHTEAAA